MPWYQRSALWLTTHITPSAKLSGRGLKIQASDNIEMLRGLGRDPLIIKETRVDAVNGLVDLMDQALAAAPDLDRPALLLYGERDEVVPREPTFQLWRDLPAAERPAQRLALYDNGWHMLLRDLNAAVVRDDIAAWIADPDAPLPSGADRRAAAALAAPSDRACSGDDSS
jgi:alpha-beta hydrolase superfamily lysophospholipase